LKGSFVIQLIKLIQPILSESVDQQIQLIAADLPDAEVVPVVQITNNFFFDWADLV